MFSITLLLNKCLSKHAHLDKSNVLALSDKNVMEGILFYSKQR